MFKTVLKVAAHTANIATLGALVAIGVTQAQAQVTQAVYTVVEQIQVQSPTRPQARPAREVQPFSDAEMQCLAENIFFEARNQDTLGQMAVAWVTLNRMTSDKYPDTICGVVKQGPMDGSPITRNRCQFSWFCDGKSDNIPSNVVAQRAWEDVQLVAEVVSYDFLRSVPSPVGDAIMYHADYVNPYWKSSYVQVATVGEHLFYN